MITQNIKVLIVDDEPKSRNILQSMITNYCEDVEVIGQANSVENAQYLIAIHNPDLVLLDIEMPFQNGFTLLEGKKGSNFEVVFVSAFDHYALKSLQFHALDYLLKPIDLDELENVIKKVKALKFAMLKAMVSKAKAQVSARNKSLENKLSITTQNGKKLIAVDKILFCKADGPYTWIQMSEGEKHYTSKNLGQVEKALKQHAFVNFFRAHHTYLINLLKVKSFHLSKNLIELENGKEIVIAQRRKKKLREILATYL